jgi:gluconokinase
MDDNTQTPWFLGIDLGTGSCKSVVVDEAAHILGFGVSDYQSDSVQSKWREQDPNAMIGGMVRSVRAAVSDAGVSEKQCAGISLGAALHGILAVDRNGDPLTGVMTWADDRASAQARKAKETGAAESLYEETGCPIHWMYPLYKIQWIREKTPEVFRQADRFISAKEFFVKRMVGDYFVDYSLAAGSGLLNTHSLNWSQTACDLTGIDSGRLSALCGPTETFNRITSEIADAMGIPSDTPFVLGSSDAVNSNLGAGAVHPWQSTCMVGTSGAFRIISPKPVLDQSARSWCYAVDKDKWLVGGAINNGGVALSWLQDMFNSAMSTASENRLLTFNDLIDLAGQAEAGAGGVICLPFFAGERSPYWNLNARAMFLGLTLQHDARHIARSLLEGVAFRMRSINEVVCEISEDIRQVRASGGFTRSPLWLQIVTNAFNRELSVPAWGETSSLGAAFWAMLGTGALSSFESIGDLVPLDRTYRPEADAAAIYDRVFEIYKSLYTTISPSFETIAGLQKELKI